LERAIFRPMADGASPIGVRAFFQEVFTRLGAAPRPVEVVVDFSESPPASPIFIDFVRGEPVFRQEGRRAAYGATGCRWLAEHDVPLRLSDGMTHFQVLPAGGDRLRVRLAPSGLLRWVAGK